MKPLYFVRRIADGQYWYLMSDTGTNTRDMQSAKLYEKRDALGVLLQLPDNHITKAYGLVRVTPPDINAMVRL